MAGGRSRRQRRATRATKCLKSGLVSLMVGQPLAFDALDRGFGAVDVADAERHAMVVTEIKFREIPMQVLLSAVLIHALHPALEDREIAFD